jgi:pimeloyl-ACP methyl ester carboxylesterase
VNGVKLHYLEWGDKNASPLLLLHPAPLNARIWETFGLAMARTCRVVAPDARGFGESQWTNSYSDDIYI